MVYNHYLEELGIKFEDWPYEKEGEYGAYREDHEGFIPAQFYDLDTTIGMFMFSHLRYFQEHCMDCHPQELSEKEWAQVIEDMIQGFKEMTRVETLSRNPRRERIIQKGLKLFAKYYKHLWY